MRIRVWEGVKRGDEFENVELKEFDGEEVGSVKEATDTLVKKTDVYRSFDGRYVIHEVRRKGEEARACVYFFSTLDEARWRFGWVLEQIGLHPSRRANLRTFEGWDL